VVICYYIVYSSYHAVVNNEYIAAMMYQLVFSTY